MKNHDMKIRRSLWATLGPVALAIVSGCSGEGPTADPELESQEQNLERDARSERIRQYFEERLARLQIVTTTKTRSGQIIDWIPIESQSPDGKIFEPPAELGDERLDRDARGTKLELSKAPRGVDRSAATELQLDPGLVGPRGTVPIVRFDVEGYLKEARSLPENPADILQKLVPAPSPASNDRYYGVWQRFGTVFGSGGRINIWNVGGPNNGETSIAQTAVIRGTPMQAIEAGKIEYPGINGGRPYLFVYYRTNDGATGDWIGGYDTTVDGWIQYSSRVAPRMSLVPWESTIGGNQYSLDVEVRLWQGNWWVKAAGEWAGYYPHCVGGSGFAPCPGATLFSERGIRDQADRLDWYGEVFDSSAPAPTSTDMGSGRFASEGWSRAAYFRNLTYYWAPNTYWWWNSGAPFATDSACYSVSSALYSNDPNWRNWYYFGGPGSNAAGCL